MKWGCLPAWSQGGGWGGEGGVHALFLDGAGVLRCCRNSQDSRGFGYYQMDRSAVMNPSVSVLALGNTEHYSDAFLVWSLSVSLLYQSTKTMFKLITNSCPAILQGSLTPDMLGF